MRVVRIASDESIVKLALAFSKEKKYDKVVVSELLNSLKEANCFIAIKDTKVLGGGAYVKYSNCNFGLFLYVLPEFRGGSVGGRLLREGVRSSNNPLLVPVEEKELKMYQKLGYKLSIMY